MKTFLLIAAITTALAGTAQARSVFHYKREGGGTVKLDQTARTITWKGNVFSNGREVTASDDCGGIYCFRAVDKSGATAFLHVATQGAANLTIEVKGKKTHFPCEQRPSERR